LRREKGRVGFDKDAVQGNFLGDVSDGLRFRVSGVASKRDEEAHIEAALGVIERAGEAMQDSAEAGRFPVLFD
jgi:hypothetical protein